MNQTYIPDNVPTVQELNFESNLVVGLIGGSLAMLIGATIWGAISFFIEYQIGWMAVGVGILVGYAIRKLGKGNTLVFGLSGAALSLLGCLLGNFFFYNGVVAREVGVSFFESLFFFIFNPGAIVEVFSVAFEIMDLLFYGIAIYVGFQSAIVKPQKI